MGGLKLLRRLLSVLKLLKVTRILYLLQIRFMFSETPLMYGMFMLGVTKTKTRSNEEHALLELYLYTS